MHFDDRLATVLRQTATGKAIARVQYRQLIDLLGTQTRARGDISLDSGYLRLTELSRTIPASERAAMLREPGVRLRSPRLVAELARAEPPVAEAALDSARLEENQWLDLLPALPLASRGFLSHRQDLGARVGALLSRLGLGRRSLPPAAASNDDVAAIQEDSAQPAQAMAPAKDQDEAPPTLPATLPPLSPAPQANEAGEAIRDIVRRIEQFRKSRGGEPLRAADEAPLLPLGEAFEQPVILTAAFDFSADAGGRITGADAEVAPMLVGLTLTDQATPGRPGAIAAAFRHRQPIRGLWTRLEGASAIAGTWRLDASPIFSEAGGGFAGYAGRMRRLTAPILAETSAAPEPQADDMRQILHELRNPVAAIQGFAEVTQQGLHGPVPHQYRAIAASIAGDAARILAAFDELDRMVRLEAGVLAPERGETDLAALILAVSAQLDGFMHPRGNRMAIDRGSGPLMIALTGHDAERLVWRLLASLAGCAAPGETLSLKLRDKGDRIRLIMALPASLAGRVDDAIFDANPAQPPALSAGMFGTGFALRLARAEAIAAGGNLVRKGNNLRLTLPGLTAPRADHSPSLQSGAAMGSSA
jgi:two-component system OmpR family sensor kinase